jgi:hypothetical protein
MLYRRQDPTFAALVPISTTNANNLLEGLLDAARAGLAIRTYMDVDTYRTGRIVAPDFLRGIRSAIGDAPGGGTLGDRLREIVLPFVDTDDRGLS